MKDKKMLRQQMKKRAADLSADYRSEAQNRMSEILLSSDVYRNARSVFVYIGVAPEPLTDRILEDGWRQGKTVLVPKCIDAQTMLACPVSSREVLTDSFYGIPEPPAGTPSADPADVDLVIVPCVSAGEDGSRLGHGRGYYDRFLAQCPGKSVCLCFEKMLSNEIPMEANDMPMNFLLTEKKLTKIGSHSNI